MNGIRSFMKFVYPKLQNIFGVKTTDKDVEEFMINLVKDTMEYREKNNISRKDLLQLMIQLRNTGNVHNEDVWDTTIADGKFYFQQFLFRLSIFTSFKENNKKLTLNEMAAQAWIFYLAGTFGMSSEYKIIT